MDGQKNPECPDCDKSFKKKSGLQVHVQTFHEGKKPYKCSLCEKCFSSKALLSRHFNQVHEKKRPYGCQLCDLRFGQKAHLVTHLKGKHKSNVSFFDISIIQTKIRTETFYDNLFFLSSISKAEYQKCSWMG